VIPRGGNANTFLLTGRMVYDGVMKIGEVAHQTGVSTKTIRYYEDIGVLPEPARAVNGYRDYDEVTVSRLNFVRDAQATGLTLTEIASILELRGQGESTCHHVVDLLDRHLEDLDRHIASLLETREQLAAMTERAKGLDPSECTDPNRCQTIEAGIEATARPIRSHVHAGPQRHSHH
jgi:DNA-binding transcriptional MerR regulator